MPSAVTTSCAPPMPTVSPAATSTRARSCGRATAHCWPPRIRSSTSRAENRVAMTEHANEAIEAIKQLKARYCRYLDTKDWAAWRSIFTDDFLSDTSEAGGKLIAGADDFVAFTRK